MQIQAVPTKVRFTKLGGFCIDAERRGVAPSHCTTPVSGSFSEDTKPAKLRVTDFNVSGTNVISIVNLHNIQRELHCSYLSQVDWRPFSVTYQSFREAVFLFSLRAGGLSKLQILVLSGRLKLGMP